MKFRGNYVEKKKKKAILRKREVPDVGSRNLSKGNQAGVEKS